MIAFGLVLLLVAFWTLIGYALQAATYQKPNLTQNALLAPALGITVTLLPVFILNRLGLPVGQFGSLLFIALLGVSLLILWRTRARFPFRSVLPFALLLILALLLVGRPLLEFGFNWVSYGNDDFANYVVNAHRLTLHGYFDTPLANDILSGRQADLFSWQLYTLRGTRIGADLLLAWVSSITGLSAPGIFMPVIVAFHACLLSAAAALVYQSKRYRRAALITGIMLSFSALITLGTVYQLIAQVLGMALACAVAVVLFRPFAHLRNVATLRLGVLAGFVVAALMISYPEIMPFVGLAFLLYVGLGVLQKQWHVAWRPLLLFSTVSVLFLVLMLNSYLLSFIVFLLDQFRGGVAGTAQVIFPYYLIPSGPSAFWGFQLFYLPPAEPLLSISIITGALLLLVSVVFVLHQSWKRTPVALIAFAMLAVGAYLFIRRSDFGLFKLTMFIQPFIIGALVIGWLQLTRRWRYRLQYVPLFLLAAGGLATQTAYVEISRGYENTGPIELPGNSPQHVLSSFEELVDSTPAAYYLSDSNHTTLYKIQSIELSDTPTEFPSAAEISILLAGFESTLGTGEMDISRQVFAPFQQIVADLYAEFRQTYTLHQFEVMNSIEPNHFYTYDFIDAPPESERVALLTNPNESVLNVARRDWFQNRFYIARPLPEVQNYLVFVESEFGQHYYIPTFFNPGMNIATSKASLFRIQPDYFYPQNVTASVGRYLLFEVLNPSESVQLRLNFTATLLGDNERLLPPAVAIGDARYSLAMMGRGAARVYSPPLTPQEIDGRYYIMLDMGTEGLRQTDVRTGIMALYGTDIALDRRLIVGQARDISVVSAEEYDNLTPPQSISSFPADFDNPNLEYSGAYEDGWLSENSFFCLAQSQTDTPLRIRVQNPDLGDSTFKQGVTVLLDGEQVLQEEYPVGEIDVSIPSSEAGRHCVELRFSTVRHFSNGDMRPFGAYLSFIGYE